MSILRDLVKMHTTCSQEVQSQILAALLSPVRDLTQNWEVDLSKHLEKYLHQLCEISINSQQAGINFAEAALLIQTSVGIYGKKVEYLWQILLQVLDSFRREQKNDSKTEVTTKRKQSRLHVSDSLQEFVEYTPSLDEKAKKRKDTNHKTIKFQPYIYAELENKDPSKKRINIFSPMKDPLGAKGDFRLNHQISNRFILEEELSVLMSIVSEIQPLLSGMDTSTSEANADPSRMEIEEGNEARSPSQELPDQLNSSLAGADSVCENDDDHHGDHFPEADLLQTVTDEYVARSENVRDNVVTLPRQENPSPAPLAEDHWKPCTQDLPEKLLKRRRSFKLPCDISSLKQDRKRKHDHKNTDGTIIMARILVSDIISCGLGKRDYFNYIQDFHIEILQEIKSRQKQERERRKRERKELHNQISREYEKEFQGFEDYEPSSGEEEGFIGYPDELPDSSPLEESSAGEFIMPQAFSNPSTVTARSPDSPDDSYQSIMQQKLKEFEVFGTEYVQSNLSLKVNSWHNSIRPVLEAAQQRGHFDIHLYGTKVLEAFPKGTAKTTIPFADVVRGESKEDVSRFFLASLMLANTYNVKISKSDPSELAMDCMELTLLTSVRHHEALDDYQAPSRERSSIPSTSNGSGQARPVISRKRGK